MDYTNIWVTRNDFKSDQMHCNKFIFMFNMEKQTFSDISELNGASVFIISRNTKYTENDFYTTRLA